jgi:tetratricopeptide (TPR) repeat protein
MKNSIKNSAYAFLFVVIGTSWGCTKAFLDKKADKSLLVPTTLDNFQALLDNYSTIMNFVPGLTTISADDFYTNDNGWSAYSNANERNSYIWAADIFEGVGGTDWSRPYQQIFYANVVLDGLQTINPDVSNQAAYNRIKGSALFYRGWALYQLAQQFMAPYDDATAGQLPGIPVPISSDVNIRPGRGTMRETYDRIISDITEAKDLLPDQPAFKNRPSKNAVLAMLARLYLTEENYPLAGQYADQCLNLNAKLIDYNTLTASASRPFPSALPNGNDEAIFYTPVISYSFVSSSATMIDTLLYRSYAANDLRKTIFFQDRGSGVFTFKGTYSGTITNFTLALFGGLATDEVFLIRAECSARAGNFNAAIQDLNTLCIKRWKIGTFIAFQASDADSALRLVLNERRKEMIARGTRWSDLRRLNRDTRFAITLQRVLKGKTYTLAPNDVKYTFPIPPDEIAASGIAQNPR